MLTLLALPRTLWCVALLVEVTVCAFLSPLRQKAAPTADSKGKSQQQQQPLDERPTGQRPPSLQRSNNSLSNNPAATTTTTATTATTAVDLSASARARSNSTSDNPFSLRAATPTAAGQHLACWSLWV